MTYAEKLKDPRWQKKRLEVMGRDNFTCQFCKDTEKTQAVHHLFYDYNKDPWEYDDDALITLCWDCHNEEHEKIKTYDSGVVTALQKLGFTTREIDLLLIIGLKVKQNSKSLHDGLLHIYQLVSDTEYFEKITPDNKV